MHRALAPLVALPLLALATPGHALECSDFRAMMQADVDRTVIQRVVYEAPPIDGWACLEEAGLVLAHLNMAVFFARLDSRDDLRWTARLSKCEAGSELRRGTRRLIDRLESRDDAPTELDEVTEVGPGSLECRRVAALKEAIDARDLSAPSPPLP